MPFWVCPKDVPQDGNLKDESTVESKNVRGELKVIVGSNRLTLAQEVKKKLTDVEDERGEDESRSKQLTRRWQEILPGAPRTKKDVDALKEEVVNEPAKTRLDVAEGGAHICPPVSILLMAAMKQK